MSTDLKTWDADREQIRRWLDELRRAGEDFDLYIDGQFDELEQLWTKLENQQRDVTGHGDELSSHVAALHESQRLLDQAAAEAQRCVDQLRAAAQSAENQNRVDLSDELAEIRAERRQLQQEMTNSNSQAQAVAEAATAEAQRCIDQLCTAAQAAANQSKVDLSDELAEIRAERRQLQQEMTNSNSQAQAVAEAAAAEAQRCIDQLCTAAQAAASKSKIDLSEELAEIRAERQQMREELAASTSQVQTLAESATADLAEVRASLTDANQSLQTQGMRLAEMAEPLQATLAAHRQLMARQQEENERRQAAAERADERSEPVPPEEVAAETSVAAAGRNTQVAGRRGRGRVDQGAAVVAATPVAEAAGHSSAAAKRSAAAPLDPVLDSVMAQFQTLQNNLAGRNPPKRSPT